MYEYTSEVFAVGLEGFAQVDNDMITELAAEGWEPTLMTTVHNGFAAVVLFRRDAGPAPRARVRRVPPPAATPARATKKAAGAAKAVRKGRSQ